MGGAINKKDLLLSDRSKLCCVSFVIKDFIQIRTICATEKQPRCSVIQLPSRFTISSNILSRMT